MHRSIRWLDRCIAAHKHPEKQNLFAIIQGGLDVDLRRQCVEAMAARDTPGYAIGGLSGGEDKNQFWRTVKVTAELLPADKPRYCMGVGYVCTCALTVTLRTSCVCMCVGMLSILWCVLRWASTCLTACFRREQRYARPP